MCAFEYGVEGQREPHPIAQRHAVDVHRRVAGLRREYVALDAEQPKPEPLVEAQRPGVRGRGRHQKHRVFLLAGDRDRPLHEHATDPLTLAVFAHG